jgi:mediator of RNA polymerase II transcription subunit 17
MPRAYLVFAAANKEPRQAHQQAMFALDFVSLLLSKDQPNQASLSISPFLREHVGMGTLGADKIQGPKVTEAQKEDNKRISKGWKIQNLNKTADSILASATRLEKEIELETTYWKQVLAISENGWAICRLPNEKHILGVRFGFSEGRSFSTARLPMLTCRSWPDI